MASMFRKIALNAAPMFRKAQQNVATLGRKITNTATQIDSGLAEAQKVVDRVDKFAPNPLTKAVSKGITGAREVAAGAGVGGQALRAGASGDVQGAANLARSAMQTASKGVGDIGAGVAAGGAAVALL